MASTSIQLLYQHPHIVLYLEDNTIQHEESTTSSDSGLYGIQVGAFEGGRDGVVLRYTNTAQYLEELGQPNYDKYGQAGYNAYRALESKSCGMYLMRVLTLNALYSNKVVMVRFKPVGVEPDAPVIDHVDETVTITRSNGITDLGSTDIGKFDLYGKVVSGLTGDTEIDGLFSHIDDNFIAANTSLPRFTFVTMQFEVPAGITVGTKIKITTTSKALKNYYSDFNEDATHITANSDGITATKVKEYAATDLLGVSGASFELAVIIEENDTCNIFIDWDADTPNTNVSEYTFSSANVEFVDVESTVSAYADEDDSETEDKDVKPGLEVQFYGLSIPDCDNEDDLLMRFAALFNENIDDDGYHNMPFMLFYAKGRGCYGNDIKIRFSDAQDVDSPTSFHRYCITVLQQSNIGLKEKEYIRGSISETSWDDTEYADGLPTYFEDLVCDIEKGSQKINCKVVAPTLDVMLELYNDIIANGDDIPEITLDEFDPIFGNDMDGKAIPTIIRAAFNGNTDEYEAINLEAIDGFALEGGSDGDMTYKKRMTKDEQQVYDEAYELALLRAFGDVTAFDENNRAITYTMYDKTLRSRYTTPADFMFDANFPNSVKVRMAEFAKKREYDCMTYLDSGLATTVTECVSWLRSMEDVYGYNIVKDIGSYRYRDVKFTRKVIPLSVTHWMAGALPAHLDTPGVNKAFARKYARLTSGKDFVPGSFGPVINPDDNDTKKIIESYKANCYESINRQTVQRASAITTCQEKSDRAEEFNEYILHRAVKIAYDIMNDNIYEVIGDDEVLAYAERAEKQIEYVLGHLLRKVKITMTSDEADRKKSILRLVMHLEFNTVAKYGAIDIYLDPRGTASLNEELAGVSA